MIAAIALMWHVVAIAALSTALSCDSDPASEHAGMENCPLHEKAPACPLHGDKHGTHDCDCPTIGCSQADAGFMALFGAVGILNTEVDMSVPLGDGEAPLAAARSAIRLSPLPLAPPPRA